MKLQKYCTLLNYKIEKYEEIEKGKLKSIKLKSFKIRKSAVEEFLKENEGNDLSDLENVKRLNGGE